MIFNEEEMLSRRQFHELFCTKFLYTGEKKDAINEDSWNNVVIHDILHVLHEDNLLTPQDIETIMQLSGMYNNNHEAYFHYHKETPIFQEILSAISPFITQAAFVKFKQLLNGRSMDSIAEFILRCCNADMAAIGISTTELYELYCTWCALQRMPVSPKHILYARLKALGFKHKKGYLNGSCGVTYFMLKLNREEVTKDAQSERTPEEKEPGTDGKQSVRNVPWSRTAVRKETVEREAPDVLSDEIRQDTPASSGGDLTEYAKDDSSNEEASGDDADNDRIGRDINPGTKDTIIQLPKDRDHLFAEAHSEGTEADIQARIKKLPMELRQCFKLLKATYRISPEHFTKEDFNQAVSMVDMSELQEEQTLYDLFLEYAKNK